MSNKRIPQLDLIGGAATASDDSFIIFDASTDTTKRIVKSELMTTISDSLTGTYLQLTGGALTGVVTSSVSSANPAIQITQGGSGAGLKITNTGTGHSLHVEDSASVDATPFVVTNAGLVGIGTATPAVGLSINTLDAVKMPVGGTADRPTGVTGYIRFNSDLVTFEGHNGLAWGEIGGGGARGGGTDKVFYENDQIVTTNYTITSGKNAMSAGPITINAGVVVTIPATSVWTVI